MAQAQEFRYRAFLSLMQRMRVPLGFLLTPVMLLAARPTSISVVLGMGVATLGLALRAWASGHLRKNEDLTVSGPYKYTRNPLYLGTFILGTGISISSGVFWLVVLFVVLYLIVYVPVMIAEARTMRNLFPDRYDAYSKRVPLFVPRVFPGRSSGSAEGLRKFDRSLYIKHREYRASLGALAVLLLLVLKEYLWTA